MAGLETAIIVNIVLAVVGLIFQVIALLLRPQQPTPEGQRREQRFSPTFGFNSVQDLAKYGDPVNLVYTNRDDNPAGGVRVNTSLVWSNVLSFGSSQFYQALTVIGAGQIVELDPLKTGFGQSLVAQQPQSRTWQYFRDGSGSGKNVPTSLDVLNTSNTATDPGLGSTYAYQVRNGATDAEGFSQAFSPTAAAALGVYAPIPINMRVRVDNPNNSGGVDRQEVGNGITSSIQWTGSQAVTVGTTLDLTIASTAPDPGTNDAERTAQDIRVSAAQGLNSGVIYRLGSSEWQFQDYISTATDPVDGNVVVRFVCIKAGRFPSTPYGVTILDGTNLQSVSVVAPGAVNTTTDTISGDFGGWVTGTKLQLSVDLFATLPSPLVAATDYFVIQTSGSTIKLATSLANAQAGTAIDLTTAGSGTITLTVQSTAQGWEQTKALVRQEVAQYRTQVACDLVDFALRGKVYRRINGRSKPNYSTGQNGFKNRQAFFRLEYKQRNATSYTTVPGIFVVRRGADNDSFFFLKFKGGSRDQWDFRFVPLSDLPAELVDGNTLLYYLSNSGPLQSVTVGSQKFFYQGPAGRNYPPIDDSPPVSREWDLFSLDSFTSYTLSSDSGPELSLNVVNEQQIETRTTLYDQLALLGINLFSGRNIQDVRQLSAFVNKGKKVRRITDSGWPQEPDGASAYPPDIFLDTILDSLNGVGGLVPETAVDRESLIAAKRFCVRNNLFFDGLIADNQNWRAFWAEKAPFALLEFTRVNGREGLRPAVPVTSDGSISRTVTISELYNEGNILDGSYKEEFLDFGDNTKDLEATVVYRELDKNSFPVQMSVVVSRTDAVNPLRQSFNLSGLVTTRAQALLFGKLLCNTRRYQRRGVEFKTVPAVSSPAPGEFIKVQTRLTAWNNIYTGRIQQGQLAGIVTVPDGDYQILLFRSGAPATKIAITVRNGVVFRMMEAFLTTSQGQEITTNDGFRVTMQMALDLSEWEGWLFVVGQELSTGRTFRISETSTDADGVITVKATEYPVDSTGAALISDFRDSLFTVVG